MDKFDDVASRWEREAAQREKEKQAKRKELFAELRGMGVAKVHVEYDGSGDSGDVNGVTATKEGAEELVLDDATSRRCEDVACHALENKHPGWEINEGSYGIVVLDVPGNKVRIEHNERIVESNYFEDEEDA